MILCPYCNRQNREIAIYCGFCNKALSACEKCKTPNPVENKNCDQCGNPIFSVVKQTSIEPRVESETTIRLLTALCFDIVNSTNWTRKIDDDEDWVGIRQQIYDLAIRSAAEFGGKFKQDLGDGGMIYFGIPAHEDDASRAVAAGHLILRELENLNSKLVEIINGRIQVRIGIHTDHVAVLNLSADGDEYDPPTGKLPTITKRAQESSNPNSILVTSSTRDILKDQYNLIKFGEVDLFYDDQSNTVGQIELYQAPLIKTNGGVEKQIPSGIPIVGRNTDLELLQLLWRESLNGDAQFILIHGEAGIGKSKLASVFQSQIDKSSINKINLNCSELHRNTPFFPIVEHFRRLARIDPDDAEQDKYVKIKNITRGISNVNLIDDFVYHIMSLGDTPSSPETPYRTKTKRILCRQYVFDGESGY